MSTTPSEVARAWAAGFFDGEGCFHLSRRTGRPDQPGRAVATISQNDRQVLDRFHRIVGVGGVFGPMQGSRKTNQNPFYVWRVGARADFDRVVEILWPYLDNIKRAAAERVAAGAGPGGNAQSRKTHCPKGHPYDEENTLWSRASTTAQQRSQRQCRTCHRERYGVRICNCQVPNCDEPKVIGSGQRYCVLHRNNATPQQRKDAYQARRGAA